ncbi:adenosylmethionine-8-amino-7-oxononanoate aminotransferase [Pseudomonas aeruginosa]|nr:adenosylmethionine-8-amino-7-oxononanoate aminotransferase [Pseudomonas aeruginosa]
MGLNADWMQRDLNVLWHPCTQMKDHERLPVIPIRRGEGVWLEDFEGKRYIDAVSSWWVNVFGHANPRINQRIKDQVDQLEHVILAGFSHQPVIELSERLVKITPPGLDRVFYADSGSAGIEVALKMSYHFWLNSGRPRKKRFVTLTNSYHGETIAAMSVGDVALFTETYKSLLLDTIKVPSPDCFLRPDGMCWEEHSRNMFAHHGAHPGRRARRDRRGHHRTADPGRRRHAHVPSGLPQAAARSLRPLWRAPDPRRDRGGLRPHRDDVRLRAGRHRPGFPLPVQGPHRRLPADVRGADQRDHLPGLLR